MRSETKRMLTFYNPNSTPTTFLYEYKNRPTKGFYTHICGGIEKVFKLRRLLSLVSLLNTIRGIRVGFE